MKFGTGGGGGNAALAAQQAAQIESLQKQNQDLNARLDTTAAQEAKNKKAKSDMAELSRAFNQSTRKLSTDLTGDTTLSSSGSLLSLGSTLG